MFSPGRMPSSTVAQPFLFALRQRIGCSPKVRARPRSGSELLLVLLFDVALFDLSHQVRSMEKIILHLGGNLSRHDQELVVDHLAPGNIAASGHQMRAPLKHERQVPQNEAGEHNT